MSMTSNGCNKMNEFLINIEDNKSNGGNSAEIESIKNYDSLD